MRLSDKKIIGAGSFTFSNIPIVKFNKCPKCNEGFTGTAVFEGLVVTCTCGYIFKIEKGEGN